MKPPAFIQVDLDGLWAVRRCYGAAEGDAFENDPVYEEGVPRFLTLFLRRKIPATFFIVGRDAQNPQKAQRIAQILDAGFEIGNHSFNHTLGLTRLSSEDIRADITRAQEAIVAAIESGGFGKEHYPVGFRAPGYDVDRRVLKILGELGFSYDASLFPTFWGFVMRWIDAYISGKIPYTKRQYGHFANGLKPLSPHPIRGIEGLYELPVSVSPVLRLPFHFGITAMRGFDYFRRCAQSYVKRGLPLVYLFHGIDFVDTRELQILPTKRGAGFFQKPIKEKLALADKILKFIGEHFEIRLARNWVTTKSKEGNPDCTREI